MKSISIRVLFLGGIDYLTHFIVSMERYVGVVWLPTSPVSMEGNTGNFLSNEKQSLEVSTSDNEVKMLTENSGSTSVFVNHAAIAWQQNRKEWIGDQSQRSKRIQKDPIISWSTTYEDLLSTYEPFSEPIPLTELVDFLVDIWLDDGLYDLDNQ
ncbi:hypothetical protein HYC85_013976 [Camellia sinensis]|uniref:Gag1-like clamp domain-containing protein n=1 Tax=Camellia sinensis TaxID=4442 RepID=A0A7J7H4Y2_CAMSI|nr:hypothetical protein HYC85_013976 [Camellia sinensis]